MSKPLGFAIVGTTGHGNRIAAPTLKRISAVSLLGGAGSTPAKGAEFAKRHGLPRAYDTFEAILADPAVDAVWICSPNHMHAAQIAKCAAAGKHVLSDKPIAISRHDAEAAVRAASEAGITLRVGYQHRFRPAHIRLRELVRAGTVGEVGYFRIHRFWPYPYYEDMDQNEPPKWRQSPSESGGWIINDIGSHLLDLMLWISGVEGRTAGAVLASHKFAASTEDSVAVLVHLGRGGIGIMETSCADLSPGSRIEIHGTKGWIRADGTVSGASTITTHDGQTMSFPAVDVMDIYRDEVNDFVAAVRGEPGMGADGAAGVMVAGIIEAAVASGLRVRAVT